MTKFTLVSLALLKALRCCLAWRFRVGVLCFVVLCCVDVSCRRLIALCLVALRWWLVLCARHVA